MSEPHETTARQANNVPLRSPVLPPRHNSGPTKVDTPGAATASVVAEGSMSSLAMSNAGKASPLASDPLVKKKIPTPTPPRIGTQLHSKGSRNVVAPIAAMGTSSERSVAEGSTNVINSVSTPALPPRHRSGLMRQGTDRPGVSIAPSEVPSASPMLPPRRPPNNGWKTIEDLALPANGSAGTESFDEEARAQENGGLVDSTAGMEPRQMVEVENGGDRSDLSVANVTLNSDSMANSSFFSTGNMADLDYSASENEHDSDGELNASQSAISVASIETEGATRDLDKRFAEENLARTAGDLNESNPLAVMNSTVGARTTNDFAEAGPEDDVGNTIRAIRRRDFDYIHGGSTPISSGRLTADDPGDSIRAIRNRDVDFFEHKGEQTTPRSESGSETKLAKAHAQAESSMLLSIKKLAKDANDGTSPLQETKSLGPPQSSSREGAQPAIDVAALVGAAIAKGIGEAEVPRSEHAIVRTARPPPRRPYDPRRYRHSPPDAMSDSSSSLRGRLKEKEVHISMLLKQLEAHGESGIQEIVSLETAKKELQTAFKLVMDGDDVNGEGEKAIAKWDKYIQNHPEHIAEQEQLVAKWDEDNRGINAEKLRLMRTYVPPDIWSTSKERLRAAGLKPDVAQRIWSKKVIWFIRAEQSRIARIHAADLDITYSIQGLDIMELRAVWASLPKTFENDGDNRKAAWRDKVATKLKEMVSKDQRGALSNVMKRARCYGSDRTATGPFDPDAPLVTVTVMRGNSKAESADDLEELCKTGGSVASRRLSLPDSSPVTAAPPAAATAAATRRRSAPLQRDEVKTRRGARPGQVVMSELTTSLRTRQGKSQSTGSAQGGTAPRAPRSLMDELRAKQKKRQVSPNTPPPAYELVGNMTTKLNDTPGDANPASTLQSTSAKPAAADETLSPPPTYHSLQNRGGEPPAANDILSQMAKIRMMSASPSPTNISTRGGQLPSPIL